MSGFFSINELAAGTPSGCATCDVRRGCRHPRMEAVGVGAKGILIIVDAPTAEDDQRGVLLSGKSGALLRSTLRKVGIDADADCRVISAIGCHHKLTTEQATPIAARCRGRVLQEQERHGCGVVVLMGQAAITAWYGHRFQGDDDGKAPTLAKLQSVCIPDPEMRCHVVCTMSPSQVLRQDFDPVVELTWRKDSATVAAAIALEPPKEANPLPCVGVTSDPAKIGAFLRSIIKHKPAIAIDYETTGLKPHRQGHYAYSVAVSPSRSVSRAFRCGADQPGWEKGGELWALWRSILHDKRIIKIAHNAGFEWTWGRATFDVETNNLEDTRLLAHLEDCRAGWTGLKFQAFIKYGIIGYENEVDRFLKTPKTTQEEHQGENGFNSVERAPVKGLLTYNAIDALVTRWLWEDYKRIPYR